MISRLKNLVDLLGTLVEDPVLIKISLPTSSCGSEFYPDVTFMMLPSLLVVSPTCIAMEPTEIELLEFSVSMMIEPLFS